MSKWEDKYEQYKDGGIDNAINELTSKGISTKEEKKEYRRLTKIKEKMPQIKNIIEYRDELKKELKELKKEFSVRENLEKASKRKEELSKEIEGYQKRYEEIVKELRNSKLEIDEREKLEEEKNKINTKMPKAQDEMDKQEEILKTGLGEKREKADLSKEEIEGKKAEIQTKVSKCNLVARNLLDGVSWEQIDIKLDNWKDKKFTSKDDKLSKDIEELKKARKEKVNNFELDREKMDDLDKVEMEENNKPAITFADKHPRLAKIGKFFRNIINRFSNKEEVQPEEDIKEENIDKPEIENVEKPFKEYIKEIAEKGMEGLATEEKETRKKELEAKLEEMRKANREAEASKFGQDYANKSDYRNKDDDGSR